MGLCAVQGGKEFLAPPVHGLRLGILLHLLVFSFSLKRSIAVRNTPEWLALQQAYAVCRVQEDALRDAIDDLEQRKLGVADLGALG